MPGSPNVTVPGPLTVLQVVVSVALGSPSSVAVPVSETSLSGSRGRLIRAGVDGWRLIRDAGGRDGQFVEVRQQTVTRRQTKNIRPRHREGGRRVQRRGVAERHGPGSADLAPRRREPGAGDAIVGRRAAERRGGRQRNRLVCTGVDEPVRCSASRLPARRRRTCSWRPTACRSGCCRTSRAPAARVVVSPSVRAGPSRSGSPASLPARICAAERAKFQMRVSSSVPRRCPAGRRDHARRVERGANRRVLDAVEPRCEGADDELRLAARRSR